MLQCSMSFTTKRRNKFKNAPKIANKFEPISWIEGSNLWVSCIHIEITKKRFTKKQEQLWLPVLATHLSQKYNIDAKTLTLTWDKHKSCYKISFDNDEEFIMLKLLQTL